MLTFCAVFSAVWKVVYTYAEVATGESSVSGHLKQSAVMLGLLQEVGLKGTQGRRRAFFLGEKCVYLERRSVRGSKN